MLKNRKHSLSANWFLIILIPILGLILFLDDTRKINPIEIRKINQTFGCGFDVVWNDWGRSELNLLKQIRVLIIEEEEAYKQEKEAAYRRSIEHLYDPPPNAGREGFTSIRGTAKRGRNFFAERRAIDSCLQFMSQKKLANLLLIKRLNKPHTNYLTKQ